jgi:sigma-B regulation protein RsbU (phosphoserine phosphatase)
MNLPVAAVPSFTDAAFETEPILPSAPRVLVADDQIDVLAALRLLLKGEGYEAEMVTSPSEILKALERRRFDALLMDLNYSWDTTSGQEGLSLLRSIKVADSTLPVIVMTGWASVDLAIESMRGGVSDFIQKPWDNAKLLSVLRSQIAKGKRHREARRKEIETAQQIEDAREIQLGLVPRIVPEIPGHRLAVAWLPSGALSGDYFDVLPLGEKQFGLCIADVVGKGVAAALLMSNIQAMVKSFAQASVSPVEFTSRINTFVCKTITDNKFITFFYGLLDTGTGVLRYANAGHNPPILFRRNGAWERLTKGGAVLGVCSDFRYEQGEVSLRSGDRLLCFTDGISEARGRGEEEFGEGRLIKLVLGERELDPDGLQSKIMQSVNEFCGGRLQDDATLIALSVD